MTTTLRHELWMYTRHLIFARPYLAFLWLAVQCAKAAGMNATYTKTHDEAAR